MTREDAIAYFKRHIELYCVDGISREAEEMAIKALEQQPCEDAISRDELLKAIDTWDKFGCDANTKLVPYQDHYIPYIHYDDVIKCIKGMPPVKPQPKMGHWTERKMHKGTGFFLPTCSECGNIQPYTHHTFSWNYCPTCGAKMQEVEE